MPVAAMGAQGCLGHTGRSCMRRFAVVVTLLTTLVSSGSLMSPRRAEAACASELFGATGSNGVDGNLYCIDPTTGSGTLIGALVDSSAQPYGMTGLAFQPGTGVLFGSTTARSTTAAGHLARIDPETALVTDVGPFDIGSTGGRPNTMSDITFDPASGILYGNSGRTGDFYTINLTTGTATALGATGVGETEGGGLATNATGTIYGTPQGTNGDLFTFNKATGVATSVAALSGAPLSEGINALAFAVGTLFGINNDEGTPSHTHLVTINTTTGVIRDVGASVDNLDALAFAGPPGGATPAPTLNEGGQILLATLLVAVGWWLIQRRRATP
jgi:hypothetical protein